jgi:class 3 adenylate cyclase
VNVASRIADNAGPDEVLVSDDTLADAGIERAGVTPIGAVDVKGVADPVWLSRM